MIRPIPIAPLVLGLAGLLPFLWGTLTILSAGFQDFAIGLLGPRFVGPYVQLQYGTIILSFMSGVLWGFATKSEGEEAAIGYGLSVIPALWAFFMVGNGPVSAAMNLIVGYVALLALDWHFWRRGLAPDWWMSLRLLLTAVVVLCLGLLVIG